MKIMHSFSCALATGVLLVVMGCGSKESAPSADKTPPPPPSNTPAEVKSQPPVVSNTPAATNPVTTPVPTVTPPTPPSPTATPPVPPSPASTNAAVTPANAQAQAILDKATQLLAQNKAAEAFNSLTQLSGMALSPEQKGLLTNLQTKASQMIADSAKANIAQTVTNQASAQAQTIIDNAKKLFGESKFAEALIALNTLAQNTLTTNQLKMVEDLKAQINEQVKKALNKQVNQEATKALNNLLPK